MSDAEPQVEAAESPIDPMIHGTFAVYEDGKGGYMLVTNTDQYGVQKKHIPGALVKMASGGGLFGRKLGNIFG